VTWNSTFPTHIYTTGRLNSSNPVPLLSWVRKRIVCWSTVLIIPYSLSVHRPVMLILVTYADSDKDSYPLILAEPGIPCHSAL